MTIMQALTVLCAGYLLGMTIYNTLMINHLYQLVSK